MYKTDAKRRGIAAVFKVASGAVLLLLSVLLIITPSCFGFENWRELDPEIITDRSGTLCVYDKDGQLISVLGNRKRIPIEIETLNKYTVDAFVAAEDTRFYTHKGVDLYRIFGAAWADIKAGGYIQGASTISQQLIKLSHLTSEKTMGRKLEEAVLAMKLERRFDKDEIMEMYLNYVYFGGGYYGIEAASLGYFGVHASELSAAQSALLTGILKSPSAYSPHLDLDASVSRRDHILALMRDGGYISDEEMTAARKEKCVLSSALPSERNSLIDHAIREAAGVIGKTEQELTSGGYSLYITEDSGIMNICERLMSDGGLFPSDNAQAAMVVIGKKGRIEAMIGGRGKYDPSGINRAAEAERQPGSLIKPILVYAPALEYYGYNAASVLNDEPTSFGDYTPRNSDEKYYGKVTLRTALMRSLNVPAVKVFSDIGIPSGVMFAEKLGIDFQNEQLGLSLALGGFTHGVTPLEMAGAYSAFPNGGVYIKPSSVDKIIDGKGRVVYERRIAGERVMSPENAYIMTSMLMSAAEEGTGKRLRETGLPLAAKTGTSIDENGVRDAWCAVYTGEHTAVIWMGTDDSSEGSLPKEAVGGNNTAVILGKLFSAIYDGKDCPEPDLPDGVERIAIDVSGIEDGKVYLAGESTPVENAVMEYFVSSDTGLVPNPESQVPDPPGDLGWSISAEGLPVISFRSENDFFVYSILRGSPYGKETTICEITGKEGYLNYTDRDVQRGASYTYRVIAYNPGSDGKRLASEPSRKMRVVIPFY